MSIKFLKDKQSRLTRLLLLLLAGTFVIGFGYVGGISLGGRSVSGGVAAEVNGEKISMNQFYLVRDNIYRQFGGGAENLPKDILSDFVNQRALQQLVQGKLLAQKAEELGFRVTSDELRDAIRTNPSFQRDGKFIGPDNYKRIITQGLNMSVGDFEEDFKEDLLARKLVNLIEESAKVTDEELFNLFKIENEKVNLYYITFSPDEFVKSISVEDKDIEMYYEKNKNNFLTFEKRKIKYLKLRPGDFRDMVNISDEQVRSYYNSFEDEFKNDDGNIKPFEEVREEIRQNLAGLKQKKLYESFSERIANSNESLHSLDKLAVENSFNKPEESGFFTLAEEIDNEVPLQIRNRVFNLKKNEVSSLKLGDDLFIFEVTVIEPRRQKNIEESKEKIIEAIRSEKANNAARIAARETLKKIRNSRETFKDISNSVGIDIKETGYFTRLKPPNDLRIKDLNLDGFFLGPSNPTADKLYEDGDKYYIFSFKDKEGVDRSEFESKRDLLRQRELSKQRRKLLSAWIDELFRNAEVIPNSKILSNAG